MFSFLQAEKYDYRDECEKKNGKKESKPDRLDGWVLSQQQRSFLEALLEDKT